jgi:hypothetical protein
MKGKRWISLVLILLGVLWGFSGCGSSESQSKLLAFPQTEWGMSKEEVQAVYGDLTGEDGAFASYQANAPIELCGQSATVEFSFFEKDGDSYLASVTANYSSDLSDADQLALLETLKAQFDTDAAAQGTIADLTESEQALYEQNQAYLGIDLSNASQNLYQCSVNQLNGSQVQLVLKGDNWVLSHLTMQE